MIKKPNSSEIRELKIGETIEKDDFINLINILSDTWYLVTRVTRTTAFIGYNDVAEGKFPRIIKEVMKPRNSGRWDQTYIKPYRLKDVQD
jgi:hypothetical protein